MNKTNIVRNALLVALGIGATCLQTYGEDLPRYKLEVGQELVYRVTKDTQKKTDATRGQISVFVVEKLQTGGWKLILRSRVALITSGEGQPLEDEWLGKEEKEINENESLTRVETATLSPEGHLELHHVFDDHQQEWMLPPLPANQAEVQGFSVPIDGWSFDGKIVSKGDSEWRLSLIRKSVLDDVSELQRAADVQFDPTRGLPTRIEVTSKGDKGVLSTEVFELKETRAHLAAEMMQLARDAEQFGAAIPAYHKAIGSLTGTKEQMTQQANKALAVLEKTAQEIRTTDLVAALKQEIKLHPMRVKYAIDRPDKVKQMVDKAAPDFTLDRVGGGKQSLSDLHGKVVVLDFWYRHCGNCIYAMPQVITLVEQEQGKPVVFLGMNTDEQESDAQFVMDKMKLNYPTLKTPQEVTDGFKVTGFPTLIIIDQQGVIRKVHVGATNSLTKDAKQDIDALLATPQEP